MADSYVDIGGERVLLSDAVKRLAATVTTLQTQNGKLQEKINSNAADTTAAISSAVKTAKTEMEQKFKDKAQVTQVVVKNYDITSIEKFNDGPHDNIHFFVNTLRRAKKLAGWDDDEFLSVLHQRLGNDVMDVVMADDEFKNATTFDTAATNLINRYKAKQTPRFYREKLLALRKSDRESVEQYADRIKQVNAMTYSLSDNSVKNEAIKEEAEQRAADTFLNGLPANLAMQTRLADPKNFKEAIAAAVRIEETFRSAKKEDTGVKKEIFATSIVRCFNCSRYGHTKSECRSPTKCFNCNFFGHTADQCRNTAQQHSQSQPPQQYYARPPRPPFQNYSQNQGQFGQRPYSARGHFNRPPMAHRGNFSQRPSFFQAQPRAPFNNNNNSYRKPSQEDRSYERENAIRQAQHFSGRGGYRNPQHPNTRGAPHPTSGSSQ
jgi:hypothetical protein